MWCMRRYVWSRLITFVQIIKKGQLSWYIYWKFGAILNKKGWQKIIFDILWNVCRQHKGLNIQRIIFWANQNSIESFLNSLCIFKKIQTANEIKSKISSHGWNLIKIQNQVSEFSLHIQATLTSQWNSTYVHFSY